MIIIDSSLGAQEIHDGSFPFPDLSNPLYISKRIAVCDGKTIAAGFVRLTCEGILIVDGNACKLARAIAGKEIIESLKIDVKSKGLDECHVFVKNPDVVRFLEHVGFKPSLGGNPMIIHF